MTEQLQGRIVIDLSGLEGQVKTAERTVLTPAEKRVEQARKNIEEAGRRSIALEQLSTRLVAKAKSFAIGVGRTALASGVMIGVEAIVSQGESLGAALGRVAGSAVSGAVSGLQIGAAAGALLGPGGAAAGAASGAAAGAIASSAFAIANETMRYARHVGDEVKRAKELFRDGQRRLEEAVREQNRKLEEDRIALNERFLELKRQAKEEARDMFYQASQYIR